LPAHRAGVVLRVDVIDAPPVPTSSPRTRHAHLVRSSMTEAGASAREASQEAPRFRPQQITTSRLSVWAPCSIRPREPAPRSATVDTVAGSSPSAVAPATIVLATARNALLTDPARRRRCRCDADSPGRQAPPAGTVRVKKEPPPNPDKGVGLPRQPPTDQRS